MRDGADVYTTDPSCTHPPCSSQRRTHEAVEQRMDPVRSALEFGMELDGDEEAA